MNTIAVVPAFNEAETVAAVVTGLRRHDLDVVVVDDGSQDATAIEAEKAGAVTLRLPTNIGVGGAVRAGFALAVTRQYRRVIIVDADLQHDPDAVPQLIDAAEASGASLVIGSRFSSGEYEAPVLRRRMMRWLAAIVSRRIGVELDDVTSGFRVVTEPLLSIYATEYPTEYLGDTVESILLAHRHRVVIAQAPARMHPRTTGLATPKAHAVGHLARLLVAMAVRRRRVS